MNDRKSFEDDAKSLVEEIESIHGIVLDIKTLNLIGYVLEQQGKKALGGLSGSFTKFIENYYMENENETSIRVSFLHRFLHSNVRRLNPKQTTYVCGLRSQKRTKQWENSSPEGREIIEQQNAQDFSESLWVLGKIQIADMIRLVCKRVLDEDSFDSETIKKKAEGLKLLGKIYQSAKVHHPPDSYAKQRKSLLTSR